MAAKKKATTSAGGDGEPSTGTPAKKAAPAKPAPAAKASPKTAPKPLPSKPLASKAVPPKPVPPKPASATSEKPAKAPAAAKPAAPAKPAATPKAAAPKAAAPAAAEKPTAQSAPKTPPKAAAAPPAKAPPKPAPKPPPKPAPKPAPKPRRAAAFDELDGPSDDDLEDKDEDEEDEDEEELEEEDGKADELGTEDVAAPVAVIEGVPGEAPKPKPAIQRVVPPMPPRKPGVVTFAFSPDADDAFMVYALAHGKVDTEGRTYELIRGDIAQLNTEAQKGTYDVTAFSFGAWPQVVTRYLALPCGASFGDQVGPVVVSKTPVRTSEIHGLSVAVPGLSTTATLVLRLWLHPSKINLIPVPFDQISAAVKAGKARAGLLIHEGQLTYKTDGLTRVIDLGQWWGEKTEGLPLPLGGNAIRRDIPADERAKIALDLKRSIAYALGHREEALDYALKFGRGLARPLLDKYVSMYVNELTLDYGERGRQAVHALYDEAVRLRVIKERVDLEFT